MKKKLDKALHDLQDVYGGEEDDSGGEGLREVPSEEEEEDDTNGTGIKLHPMQDPS